VDASLVAGPSAEVAGLAGAEFPAGAAAVGLV
jgi:hypothetical protein